MEPGTKLPAVTAVDTRLIVLVVGSSRSHLPPLSFATADSFRSKANGDSDWLPDSDWPSARPIAETHVREDQADVSMTGIRQLWMEISRRIIYIWLFFERRRSFVIQFIELSKNFFFHWFQYRSCEIFSISTGLLACFEKVQKHYLYTLVNSFAKDSET